MPPMPRGSLRCFRKKYSSHQRLEARVQVGAERRERVAAGAVEVRARLPRSRSTASGPCRRRTSTTGSPPVGSAAQHAHVHVHGRHVRVARMEHQRHAHRLERRAGQLAAGAASPTAAALARARARSCSRRARAARRLRAARETPSPSSVPPGLALPARRRRSAPPSVGLERGDDALPAGRAGSRATAARRRRRSRRMRVAACAARDGRCRAGTARRRSGSAQRPRRRAAAPA